MLAGQASETTESEWITMLTCKNQTCPEKDCVAATGIEVSLRQSDCHWSDQNGNRAQLKGAVHVHVYSF